MSENKPGSELEVRNFLGGEVFVTIDHGLVVMDLRKCKPPVIVTLSPGRKRPGLEEFKKLDLERLIEPFRRPVLGTRKA